MSATVVSTRRFYLLKTQAARQAGDSALELVWLGKQRAEHGTDLPSDFPSLAVLAAANYTTVEDLNGADERELAEIRILGRQAEKVFAALASLV